MSQVLFFLMTEIVTFFTSPAATWPAVLMMQLAVHAGGQHFDAVAEFVEGLRIHGVRRKDGGRGRGGRDGRFGGRGQDIRRDRLGERLELGVLALGERGLERDAFADVLDLLQSGEDLAHGLAAHRRPGAVFDDRHLAVLQVVRGDIMQQVLHRHEHAGVVGRGREMRTRTPFSTSFAARMFAAFSVWP